MPRYALKNKRFMKKTLLTLLAALVAANSLNAQIKMPGIFTDGMVIQRDTEVNVWGSANAGAKVSVQFAGQKVSTKADDSGAWSLKLSPVAANAKPQKMTVTSGREKKVFSDVLVGEVWFASGQSNMEFNMGPVWRSGSTGKVDKPARGPYVQAADLFKPEREMMRAIIVEKVVDTDSLPTHGWMHVNAETIAPFSAAAYYFAQNLIDSLKVPVGIIESCWGGTKIETWTPEEAYLESDLLRSGVKNHCYDEEQIGLRFEHMVREIIPFSMRGIIWYQGESNLMMGHIQIYSEMQKVLVESWRKLWGIQLPFYFVQLAPYTYSIRRDKDMVMDWATLPEFREAQEKSLELIPDSGMAVILDLVDNLKDIHPTYKWELGKRLAKLALKGTYGRGDIVSDGPKVVKAYRSADGVVVEFDSELKTNDGQAPRHFSISSNGKKYFQVADAIIEGNKVRLRNSNASTAAHVRYAWDEDAITNLCNTEGLPAWQFRIDL